MGLDDMKIGDYEPMIVSKDNESFVEDLANGDVYWTVRTSEDGYMDVERQTDAVIISMLIELKRKVTSIQTDMITLLDQGSMKR